MGDSQKKFLPPDDPTAVYPIGALNPQEPEPEPELPPPPPPPPLPPMDFEEDFGTRDEVLDDGGFNPMIALAVFGVGAVLAALGVVVIGAILFLL